MLSLWLPKRALDIGEQLTIGTQAGDPAIYVTDRLMLVSTLKQKRGVAPRLSALDFYPETNDFQPYKGS